MNKNTVNKNGKGIVNLQGKEYATYQYVLGKAHKEGLESITTDVIQLPTKENDFICIIKATVIVQGRVFEGIGDATPRNVNSMIAKHLIRMAETRAKGRALRDAVNIGETILEEL